MANTLKSFRKTRIHGITSRPLKKGLKEFKVDRWTITKVVYRTWPRFLDKFGEPNKMFGSCIIFISRLESAKDDGVSSENKIE